MWAVQINEQQTEQTEPRVDAERPPKKPPGRAIESRPISMDSAPFKPLEHFPHAPDSGPARPVALLLIFLVERVACCVC
jgi:hypothetical protein